MKLGLTKVHSSIDNQVHIEPNGSHDPASTLCYEVDIMETTYTPTDKKVTCMMCQNEFDTLKNGLKLI